MRSRHRLFTIGIVHVVVATACAEAGGVPAYPMGERLVREVTDTVMIVGGSAEDTLLYTPTMVALTEDGVVVWDRDQSRLLSFSDEGELRWIYGRKGAGPGEFAGVTQIAVDHTNRVWVLDPDNVRISIIGSNGELERAFRIPDVGHVDRLVPLGDDRAMLMGLDPMVHMVDDHGALQGSRAHPYLSYATLHPISAYNRALYDAESDSAVFFFYYGGGFLRTDPELTPVATLTSYVENIPFPEVVVQRTEGADGTVRTSSMVNASRLAAKAGTADAGVLNILFQGDTEYGNRMIDRYSIGSGEYLGSWLLPDSARTIDVRRGLVAALVENPYPALVVRQAPEH